MRQWLTAQSRNVSCRFYNKICFTLEKMINIAVYIANRSKPRIMIGLMEKLVLMTLQIRLPRKGRKTECNPSLATPMLLTTCFNVLGYTYEEILILELQYNLTLDVISKSHRMLIVLTSDYLENEKQLFDIHTVK